MTVNTDFGKITGSKTTLNSISLALNYAADKARDAELFGFYYQYDKVSKSIYDALKEVGYYD